MAFTIRFKGDDDPLMEQIRTAARSEGWSGMLGFKDWARETYGATLRSGKYDDWTSISFKTQQQMDQFRQDFSVLESPIIINPMPIFQKHYNGESIVDVSRDVWEAFDADFNPVISTIPLNQWNMHQGTFRVTIEWEPN